MALFSVIPKVTRLDSSVLAFERNLNVGFLVRGNSNASIDIAYPCDIAGSSYVTVNVSNSSVSQESEHFLYYV